MMRHKSLGLATDKAGWMAVAETILKKGFGFELVVVED